MKSEQVKARFDSKAEVPNKTLLQAYEMIGLKIVL